MVIKASPLVVIFVQQTILLTSEVYTFSIYTHNN